MKVEYSEETSIRKALTFEVEAEVVDREIETKVREYSRKARLPGFRPGKVAPEVIKKRFRAQILEAVTETIVNRVVFEELEGRGLKPVGTPRIADLKIDEGQAMTFRAVFETLPLIEVPEYRGLSTRVKKAEVTDEDVAKELERIREGAARFDPVEGRPVQRGDFVVLDLSWRPSKGGKGGHDENALIEVGGSQNHPGLSDAIEGSEVGDSKKIRLDYPADHSNPALANQSVDYRFTVKAIKQKVVPPLDDEFAKDLEHDDLGALKKAVQERLMAAEDRRVDRDTKNALLEALADRADFEVPEALIEHHMSARTENAARGLAVQGIDPSRIGVDWSKFRESQREGSAKAARAGLLIEEIARIEGIEVLPAEIDAEVARAAERLRTSPAALRARLQKDGDLTALSARIREEKTLDLLKANARLTFE